MFQAVPIYDDYGNKWYCLVFRNEIKIPYIWNSLLRLLLAIISCYLLIRHFMSLQVKIEALSAIKYKKDWFAFATALSMNCRAVLIALCFQDDG